MNKICGLGLACALLLVAEQSAALAAQDWWRTQYNRMGGQYRQLFWSELGMVRPDPRVDDRFDEPDFLNMAAANLLKIQRPSAALPYLYEALAQEPDNKESNKLLDKALKELDIDPTSFEARWKHARQLNEQKLRNLRGVCVELRAALALKEDAVALGELGCSLMEAFECSGEWRRSRDRFDFVDCLSRSATLDPSPKTALLLLKAYELEESQVDKEARLKAVDLMNSRELSKDSKDYLVVFWREQTKRRPESDLRRMCYVRALEVSGDKTEAQKERAAVLAASEARQSRQRVKRPRIYVNGYAAADGGEDYIKSLEREVQNGHFHEEHGFDR